MRCCDSPDYSSDTKLCKNEAAYFYSTIRLAMMSEMSDSELILRCEKHKFNKEKYKNLFENGMLTELTYEEFKVWEVLEK
jgi:hypothetical protein